MWGVKIGVFEAAEQLPDVSLSLNPSISPEIMATPIYAMCALPILLKILISYYILATYWVSIAGLFSPRNRLQLSI